MSDIEGVCLGLVAFYRSGSTVRLINTLCYFIVNLCSGFGQMSPWYILVGNSVYLPRCINVVLLGFCDILIVQFIPKSIIQRRAHPRTGDTINIG